MLPPAGQRLEIEEWNPLDRSGNLPIVLATDRWYRTARGWAICPEDYERYDVYQDDEGEWWVTAEIRARFMIAEHYYPPGEMPGEVAHWHLAQQHRDAYEVRPTVWPDRVDAFNWATGLIRRHHPVVPPPVGDEPYLPAGPVTYTERLRTVLSPLSRSRVGIATPAQKESALPAEVLPQGAGGDCRWMRQSSQRRIGSPCLNSTSSGGTTEA